MIRPPGQDGAVFTGAAEGDLRHDLDARASLSQKEGIPDRWATVAQVHGNEVVRVEGPGDGGPADALWTTVSDLAVVVFTADCFGVVLEAPEAVGVAHAGWRGARDEVVSRLREEMEAAGHEPVRAAVGPGIGPCCFEVGTDVSVEFPESRSTTSWGTASVDLRSVIERQLDGVDTWFSDVCTHHQNGFFSHRATATPRRTAAIGWIP